METTTRTEYSIKNASVALIVRIVAILTGFFTRVVLTRMMNADYVGINGLFSNILGALTLSELGIETALVYALYKPVAEKDEEKQRSLLALYRTMYPIIAMIVVGIGIVMFPILRILMRDTPQVEHLLAIYALYIANTVATYFFAQYNLLFLANQKNYINNYFYASFIVLQDIVQIFILIYTRNYLLFILVQLICNLLRNVSAYLYARKAYPFITEPNAKPIERAEKKGLFRNLYAMLLHKVGLVVINNTDNLCLTFFAGLMAVGKYANYYLIIGSIRQLADNTIRGISGSVGNLAVDQEKEDVYSVFTLTLFLTNWIYGFCAICLFMLLNPFIKMSFGEQYLFGTSVTAILCVNFYLNGIRQATLIFRDALGLFWYDRHKTVVESIVNLSTSILLAMKLGTVGVFIGTTISILTVSIWVEPLVLYKRYLSRSLGEYFRLLGGYALVTGLAGVFVWGVSKVLPTGRDILQGGLLLLMSVLISNLVYCLCFRRTRQFKQFTSAIKLYAAKKFGRVIG